MAHQYRVQWSGTTGGTGFSVLNARLSGAALGTGPQQFADNVRAFFLGLQFALPNEVVLSFNSEVLELDTSTGQLLQVHPVTPPNNVAGSATGSYAHASGIRLDWLTPSVLNGRRLRGRTYLVPAASAVFDTSGRLTTTAQNNIKTAGNAYVADMENIGSAAVWSRTHGIIADVEEVGVSPLGAVLRSRRD